MNWINRFTDRIGNALRMRTAYAFALAIACALCTTALSVAAELPANGPSQITGVTVSQDAGNAVVDLHVRGNVQYEWHRLREPDNRFWIDVANAQLTVPAQNSVEPAPLGAIRLRQIDPTTVRLAIALTSPKVLDVLPVAGGVRIVVHPEDAGADIARSGTGAIVVADTGSPSLLQHTARTVSGSQNGNATASDSIGPTAAEIAAIEHGKSPAVLPIPSPTPTPLDDENSNDVTPGGAEGAISTPTPIPDVQGGNTGGPTAAQIAAMTGEATPTPNPLLTASPGDWKFAPKPKAGNYAANNPRLIVIDPGHGGSDRGASRHGVDEATLTLDIAKRLRDILIARGWQVMMTRTTDVDVYKPYDTAHQELQARVDVGNHAGARIFVSIHANSFTNSVPSGTTTYYSKPVDVPLATDVQKQLAGALGTKDDGIVKSHLYVTLHSNMPAILVETAFLSNPGDFAKLTSSAWRQKVAEGIANGIATYAGAPPK